LAASEITAPFVGDVRLLLRKPIQNDPFQLSFDFGTSLILGFHWVKIIQPQAVLITDENQIETAIPENNYNRNDGFQSNGTSH